jgi:hypothetical protein
MQNVSRFEKVQIIFGKVFNENLSGKEIKLDSLPDAY